MAAEFTTWTALYTAMLNAYTAYVTGGNFSVADYNIQTPGNSRRITYRTMEEFERGLKFVKYMADQESGAAVGRTYAKQVSR